MECSLCLQITHALCIGSKASAKILGIVNDDLPNSWECPICIEKSMKVPRPLNRGKSGSTESKESSAHVYPVISMEPNGTSPRSGNQNVKPALTNSIQQLSRSDAPGSSSVQVSSESTTVKKENTNKSKVKQEPVVNGISSTDKVKPVR